MDFEQYLQSKEGAASVDADTLKMLGRKAALQFVEDKKDLSSAVSELSKEANLNDEQTKRVLEFANNMSFSELFKAGFSQNITFPMAEPGKILGGGSVEKTKQASVHVTQSGRYIPGQERASLEGMFGASFEKTAGAPKVDRAELTTKYMEKRAQLRNLQSDSEVLADGFVLKLAELDIQVRNALQEGNAPYVIGACMEAAKPDSQLVRYLDNHYSNTIFGKAVEFDGGVKLAQAQGEVVPNPITDLVGQLSMMQQQLMQTQDAIAQSQQTISGMLQTLQQPAEENPGDKLFKPSTPPPQAAVPAEAAPQQSSPQAQETATSQPPAI